MMCSQKWQGCLPICFEKSGGNENLSIFFAFSRDGDDERGTKDISSEKGHTIFSSMDQQQSTILFRPIRKKG